LRETHDHFELDDINAYINNFSDDGGSEFAKIKDIVVEAKQNKIPELIQKTCLTPFQTAENILEFDT